ncbi:MAG: LysR family transcriptional regulator [Paludibacterium sp.]|uniref:LysR family transcriptional regulator n=1 Tax=Paludibacterium sp. TaxID=1917523 RepID=UPI0025EDF3BA|nr:LysR family transcriptional regulator [Paludibacterium sp.]MBV8047990.1 LysR family transcriptional regulator [Paludibacterium sp.]MBV8649158.1 LysR family transcriptional regulator [Paludibacterium sp.]
MDRFSEIKAFVTVAEQGSFVAASERMDLSRAMVTKLVSALEARLGVRLMHRTTRRLSLTAEGESYLAEVSPLLGELDALESRLSQGASRPAGRLRVTAPVSFGERYLGAAMTEFCRQYPDIEIDLSLNDRRVDLVEEGYDLALRITQLSDSSLIARRLMPVRGAVCASPAYLREHGTPLHPEALIRHNCLVYTLTDHTGFWPFVDTDGSELRVKIQGSLRANNGDLLLDAAINGLGITRQPRFMLTRALERGDLVELLHGFDLPNLALYAVYPVRRHVPGKVRALVDFLLAYCEARQAQF